MRRITMSESLLRRIVGRLVAESLGQEGGKDRARLMGENTIPTVRDFKVAMQVLQNKDAKDLKDLVNDKNKQANIEGWTDAVANVLGAVIDVGIGGAGAGVAAGMAATAAKWMHKRHLAYRDAHKQLDPRVKEQNPFWDHVTIDPEKSKVIDNKVERDFIDHLMRLVQGKSDSDPMPGADEVLNQWLHDNYRNLKMVKSNVSLGKSR